MRGEAEHMLHLQVSHLKIPIHYIVYGKVTPFTDHYATLLCPGVPWYNKCHRMDVFCKGTVLKVKECRPLGCFSSLKICSIIQPPENIHPLLIDRVYTWSARQPVQLILSTTVCLKIG